MGPINCNCRLHNFSLTKLVFQLNVTKERPHGKFSFVSRLETLQSESVVNVFENFSINILNEDKHITKWKT